MRELLRLAREIQRQNYHSIYLFQLFKLTESTSAESSSSFKDNVVPLLPRGNWSGMLTLLDPLGRTLLSLSALLRWSAMCASWVLLRRRPRLKEFQTNFKIRARNCLRYVHNSEWRRANARNACFVISSRRKFYPCELIWYQILAYYHRALKNRILVKLFHKLQISM